MKKILLAFILVIFLNGCNQESTVKYKGKDIILKENEYTFTLPDGYEETTSDQSGKIIFSAKSEQGKDSFGMWNIPIENTVQMEEHISKLIDFSFEKTQINGIDVYFGTMSNQSKNTNVYLYIFDFDKKRFMISAISSNGESLKNTIEAIIATLHKN